MVESMANSVEDYLIDGLSFKLKPGASYVNERKSVTYHPQGSNVYKAGTGTKLIKFQITGDQWLDPSTFRVAFDLENTAPESDTSLLNRLRPLGGAHTFFKRMRLLCNGQIVEDIDDYNRVHEMFHILQSIEDRVNDEVEGFGADWDITNNEYNREQLSNDNLIGIRNGDYRTVLFKPLSGLLKQQKYIPLRYCPLTLELELVNSAEEPVVSDYDDASFNDTNTDIQWEIKNPMIKCDVCTLDNALDNSYAEHLLSGKSLPINYNTFVSQIQTILSGTNTGQQKVRLNVTRALSRLKSVFVTLYREFPADGYHVGRKKWNSFYSPMFAQLPTRREGPDREIDRTGYAKYGEFEFQLQLGSKLYPEYPIRSHAEAYYQLKKTVGLHSNKVNAINANSYEYRSHKMIIGIDTEKVLEAGFTGANTRAGDIMNIRFDHNSGEPGHYAHEMHIVLHSDNIMEIRDSGVTIFD